MSDRNWPIMQYWLSKEAIAALSSPRLRLERSDPREDVRYIDHSLYILGIVHALLATELPKPLRYALRRVRWEAFRELGGPDFRLSWLGVFRDVLAHATKGEDLQP